MELPNQDDAMLRFPMDDITAPFTSCELHIPKENATIMVALSVFSPPDPTKTPIIHGAIIPPGYVSLSVDRVNKGFSDLALDIPGGDGDVYTRIWKEDLSSRTPKIMSARNRLCADRNQLIRMQH